MPNVLAPTPPAAYSSHLGANAASPPARTMTFACQTCTRRKVKCDKSAPVCSTCRKSKLDCTYQAPLPRRRKRRMSNDADEKLARYEGILSQHGLLPQETEHAPAEAFDGLPEGDTALRYFAGVSKNGTLLSSQGKTRYIDGSLWRNLGEDDMEELSNEGPDGLDAHHDMAVEDPLTGALVGDRRDLTDLHPSHQEAMLLWDIYCDNVEPLIKMVHVPSTGTLLKTISKEPIIAAKGEECLLFAIYHFAIFSMTDADCEKRGWSRERKLKLYHFAARQALVNATFLKTTELIVEQALILFLLPCRHHYDSHTYWILTGVAARIAQRLGLHRDGEGLNLPPFDIQMRRRIFYRLVPLDGVASQMAGTGIGIIPDSWDTIRPLDINDDQIWPGMTEQPVETKGATEMIFCLARACAGSVFAKAGRTLLMPGVKHQQSPEEIERIIADAETEVEEKYIRYCDIVNPLHFLTIAISRSAISAMRIKVRFGRVRHQISTEKDRKELYQLALKTLDTDIAARAHAGVKGFMWHTRSFFAWGSWDSIIFLLTSLQSPESVPLTQKQIDVAWDKIQQVYNDHSEFLELKQALYAAIGRLAVKAWDAHPRTGDTIQPDFVLKLRNYKRPSLVTQDLATPETRVDTVMGSRATPKHPVDAEDPFGIGEFNMETDMNLDNIDWTFWDQLVQGHQT
ncbi:putative fungal-specific transcription factor [Elsinoe ampelina]|uniref:Putative fungal-specific transcription factor n=1 Tax=Elsinoe ampelina TaxID=302913 RepID=A0A6A6G6B8_9PEZI|nr:putative fungal-specific transcription factor [Elsinoe ampelina]